MKKLVYIGLFSLATLFSQSSNASVACNYCSLSTDGSNPTSLNFVVGDNLINSLLLPVPTADSRFFSFNIANGFQLSSITLDAFTYVPVSPLAPTATGVAFFGLKQGASITPSTVNPSAVDGYALLGAPVSSTPINGVIPTNVGQDLFPSLIASGAFTGTTLSSSLGAGNYTVWLRESRTIDVLSLNFKVTAVPVPAAIWLMGSALLGFVGFNKRRR
jgi:hypothetical protein